MLRKERKNAVQIDPVEFLKREDMDMVHKQYAQDDGLDDFDFQDNREDSEDYEEEKEGAAHTHTQEEEENLKEQPGSHTLTTLIEEDIFLNQKNYIDFFNNLDWIGGSLNLKMVNSKKIASGLRKNWAEATESYYDDNHNALYFLTGKINDMVVLDIDNPEGEESRNLMDVAENCTMIVKTNKGYHFYFKYDETFSSKRVIPNVGDLQSTGAMIYCPPTEYYDEKKNRYEYQLLKCGPLVSMTASLKQKIIDLTSPKLKIEKKRDLVKEIINKVVEKPLELEVINNIIAKCYKQSRADIRDEWLKVGMALKTSYGDEGLDVWHTFSKRSSKFKGLADLQTTWKSFKEIDNPLTFKSLLKWGLEDNKKAYEKIMGKEVKDASQIEQKLAQYLIDNYHDFFWTEDEGETKLYVWDYEEKKWVFDTKGKRSSAMGLLDKFLMNRAVPHFSNSEAARKMLGKIGARRNIIEVTASLKSFKTRIIWEKDPLLLGYDNGVLNILTGEFREKQPKDFIKMSVKRNYELDKIPVEIKKKLTEEVWGFIKSIFYKEDIREYMLKAFSTCLYGMTMEHFYILNGCGGNGKSAWDDLIITALGDYAILANNSLLTEAQENKSNPFLAALENKRAVFFREPKKNKPLSNANIKDLTGSDVFATRDLYQNSTQTQKSNCGTYFCECNQKPLLEDEANIAEKRRIRDILFATRFVEDQEDVNEEEGIFIANPMFKTKEWKLSVADILIEILIGYFQQIYPQRCFFTVPEEVTKRSIAYMSESSMILNWLNDHYQRESLSIPIQEQNRIALKDLYNNMVTTLPINANEKRTKNQAWLRKELLSNFEISKYFFERKQFGQGDEQIYSTLFGWVLKA